MRLKRVVHIHISRGVPMVQCICHGMESKYLCSTFIPATRCTGPWWILKRTSHPRHSDISLLLSLYLELSVSVFTFYSRL